LSQLTPRRGSVEARGLIGRAIRALAIECQRRLVKAFIVGRSGADEWRRVGALLVAIIIVSWRGVLAPAGLERFCNRLWLREFQVASLLGDESALGLGLQLWHQLCDEPASLLRVQVARLLGDVNQGSDDLVMALFGTLAGCAARAANLNGQLLAVGVADKLARLLLNVAGGARALVKCLALLGARSIADLLDGLVALLDSLIEGLLLEGDLASLLKVLIANFFLLNNGKK
jgi:hypothetical protein